MTCNRPVRLQWCEYNQFREENWDQKCVFTRFDEFVITTLTYHVGVLPIGSLSKFQVSPHLDFAWRF